MAIWAIRPSDCTHVFYKVKRAPAIQTRDLNLVAMSSFELILSATADTVTILTSTSHIISLLRADINIEKQW